MKGQLNIRGGWYLNIRWYGMEDLVVHEEPDYITTIQVWTSTRDRLKNYDIRGKSLDDKLNEIMDELDEARVRVLTKR